MLTGELKVGLAFLLMIIICYVAGRLHQWAKHGIDRDAAFREGYDQATHSLFALATAVRSRVGERKVTTKEMPAPVQAQVAVPPPVVPIRSRAEFRPVPVLPVPPSLPQTMVSRQPSRRRPRHAA